MFIPSYPPLPPLKKNETVKEQKFRTIVAMCVRFKSMLYNLIFFIGCKHLHSTEMHLRCSINRKRLPATTTITTMADPLAKPSSSSEPLHMMVIEPDFLNAWSVHVTSLALDIVKVRERFLLRH